MIMDSIQINTNNKEELKDTSENNIHKRKRSITNNEDTNNERTIFINNVNISTKKNQIKKLFSEFNLQIETIRFRSIPLTEANMSNNLNKRKGSIYNKKFDLRKRDNCNCYVVFNKSISDTEYSNIYNKLNGALFNEKHIFIDRAVSKLFDRNCSLFLGNLPFSTNEEDVYLAFQQHKIPIQSVRIVRDSTLNVCRGIGYIQISDNNADKSINACLKLNNILEIKDRKIRITKIQTKAKRMKKFSKKR